MHKHCAPTTGQYCPPIMVGVPEAQPADDSAFLPPTDDPEEFVRRLDDELDALDGGPTGSEGAESPDEL